LPPNHEKKRWGRTQTKADNKKRLIKEGKEGVGVEKKKEILGKSGRARRERTKLQFKEGPGGTKKSESHFTRVKVINGRNSGTREIRGQLKMKKQNLGGKRFKGDPFRVPQCSTRAWVPNKGRFGG